MLNTLWSLGQRLLRSPYLQAHTEIISNLRHISLAAGFTGAVIFWLCLVRALRWRRYNAIHQKFGTKWNNGLGTIAPQEAQEIMHVSCLYDMPWLVSLGGGLLVFLNTYGIPSMSKLFVATKELLLKDTIRRRFSDTDMLISTWQECPLSGFIDPSFSLKTEGQESKPADDPRANIAIARTNWIHSKYKISNDDFLYTLCLNTLEPMLCVDRYGWRCLSPLEKEAYYVFWAEIGRRLNIHDIPATLEGLITWRMEYERTHKTPAQTNRSVARATIEEILDFVPGGCKILVQHLTLCLIDDRTRQVLMYEKPPLLFHAAVSGLFNITAFVQRFFLLPRTSGKFMVRLKSEGYRIEELGPIKWAKEGHEEVMKNATELLGCPITKPWSLKERKTKS